VRAEQQGNRAIDGNARKGKREEREPMLYNGNGRKGSTDSQISVKEKCVIIIQITVQGKGALYYPPPHKE